MFQLPPLPVPLLALAAAAVALATSLREPWLADWNKAYNYRQ